MEPAMRMNEVRHQVERRPFRPFRICMSDGAEHVISHPNFVLLTRHTVILGIPEEGEDLPEDSKYCDAVHIARVETLGGDPTAR